MLYSSAHAYLVTVDSKSGESSLLKLQPDVFEMLSQAPQELIDLAFGRIRRIDYRTVSIMDFEQTLLGCFDPSRTYRIVSPDGSGQ